MRKLWAFCLTMALFVSATIQGAGTVSADTTNSEATNIVSSSSEMTNSEAVNANAAPAIKLTDIDGHWAEATIREMVDKGIIKGFPDKTYRPEAPMTEEQFFALLHRSVPKFKGHKLDNYIYTSYLKNMQKGWSKEVYDQMMVAGIVPYNPPGTLIDRLSATRLMLTALGEGDSGRAYQGTKEQWFKDISLKDEYEIYFAYPAYKLGLIEGYPDDTFRPKTNLTRAQAAVVLKRFQQKMTELYPDNVNQDTKQQVIKALTDFFVKVDLSKIKNFSELEDVVKKNKLPASKAFLDEHFGFLKVTGTDFAAFPAFDELIYITKVKEGKYRVVVQYYSGELVGSLARTFYVTSTDGNTFVLVGKNE
ncbi:S-layer homology domain-containing protein [Brevibacillus dissolubilis]|uniref:S-layer homology domain-containing protein n=1 Tax=Brevibacillus dissolubilis TaxID=1844116 RepID=UPI00159BBFB1|nr:S-layer homology domain-containing protein [Brevibacillus dissolubilis]